MSVKKRKKKSTRSSKSTKRNLNKTATRGLQNKQYNRRMRRPAHGAVEGWPILRVDRRAHYTRHDIIVVTVFLVRPTFVLKRCTQVLL